MADISKPDANPVVAAILTFFVFNLGHLLINGQQKKWLFTFIVIFIGYILLFIPGLILAIMSVIDSYQTAERLKNGETIPDNEYTMVPLYKIVKIIDSSATCKAAG
ncbi:MAG TPA: hypothetical protein VEJ63_02450 [Planctomycetota bacterium]|nr:hypothetical protein [Planctomycetota bacterium]